MTFDEMCKEELNYTTKTTFWMDFSIADRFGLVAIKDTYKRAFKEWKSNVEYLTELVLVLNHKIWQHYDKNNLVAKLYNALWEQTDNWATENLTGEELNYYFKTLD